MIGNKKTEVLLSYESVFPAIYSSLEHLLVHCVASPLALRDLALRRVFLLDGGAVVHN